MLAWGLASAIGAEADRQAADEAAIRKAVESYVAAFNKGMPRLWRRCGRPKPSTRIRSAASRSSAARRSKNSLPGFSPRRRSIKLEAKTDSIRFVSPNVAVEQGTAKVIRPDQAPEESEYTAVYVKRDGQWLLDRVTEEDVPVVTSHYEQLKDLEWMIGRWVDQDDEATVVTECNWTKNNNFMTRSFTIQIRRPDRHGRDADHRLGPVDQADSLVGLRLGRRLRPGDVEEEGQPLVHPTNGRAARWSEVLGGQHRHPPGRQHVHAPVRQPHGGRRVVAEYRRSQDREGVKAIHEND